jgi:hypothetical protein
MKVAFDKNSDIKPWIHISEAFGPANPAVYAEAVRSPDFASVCICSICAIRLGGDWPRGKSVKFTEAECPCCGRIAPVTESGHWSFADGL